MLLCVCWWGKGWPVLTCTSRELVVPYRMLTIFACYVLTYVRDAVSISTTSLRCLCHTDFAFRMTDWTSCHGPHIFTCYIKDNQQGCSRLSNWFSLWRLGPWMNHFPPAWYPTFSAHSLQWELVCKFGVRFHIFIIISCLGSRFHAWN